MVANGMEVNMETEGSADRDGSALDYCRLNEYYNTGRGRRSRCRHGKDASSEMRNMRILIR